MNSMMRLKLISSGLKGATHIQWYGDEHLAVTVQKTCHHIGHTFLRPLLTTTAIRSSPSMCRANVEFYSSRDNEKERHSRLTLSTNKPNISLTANEQRQPPKWLSVHDDGFRNRQMILPFGKPSAAQWMKSNCFRLIPAATFGTSTLRFWSTEAPGRHGMFAKMWERLGFTGKMRYPKIKLRKSGLRLYLSCVELVDHDVFFKEFNLPDTFNSWFRITELHVWLGLVRLAQEGKEGKFVRNNLVEFMWEDLDKRSRKLGSLASSSRRRKGLSDIAEQFQAALFSYDEGALGDDMLLAGALWRTFFEMKLSNLEHLETLVEYIRKQLQHLDQQESQVVLGTGLISFLPLHGDLEDKARTKTILRTIINRV